MLKLAGGAAISPAVVPSLSDCRNAPGMIPRHKLHRGVYSGAHVRVPLAATAAAVRRRRCAAAPVLAAPLPRFQRMERKKTQSKAGIHACQSGEAETGDPSRKLAVEQLPRVLWKRNGPDSHRFCRLTRKRNRGNGLTLAAHGYATQRRGHPRVSTASRMIAPVPVNLGGFSEWHKAGAFTASRSKISRKSILLLFGLLCDTAWAHERPNPEDVLCVRAVYLRVLLHAHVFWGDADRLDS